MNEVLVNTVTPCQMWILFMYTLDKFTYTNFVPTESCLCGVFKLQALTGMGRHLLTEKLQSAEYRDNGRHCGNEPLGSIKCGEFLDWPRTH